MRGERSPVTPSGNDLGDIEITDPKAMRALAHPVRLAVLERLQRHGPATATRLSTHVGATPSVTSRHLRHPAGFGPVRHAEGSTARRERRWEAVARGFRFAAPTDLADDAGLWAARVPSERMVARTASLLRRWAAETAPGLHPRWRGLAGLAHTRTRLKVARAHAKVADARREFLHHLSTKLIRENQAIGVEDLAVKGLARTRLAKSVHDAGWAQFVAMLEYKAVRYGRTLVKIGRFEPTSQTCSACGVKDGPKPLRIREWTCPACGTVHDRDHNAAKNVKTAAGLAVTACGAPVRPGLVPAQREETGSHGFPPEPCAA